MAKRRKKDMASVIPVDTQQLQGVILRQVDGMRNDKKHCDFLIKVGSVEIPVHRNIICATSAYFDKMFSHPTRENESGVVEMIGVDPECAIICVDHMYGKEVSISPEKYEPLMYAADSMELLTLRDAIATLLEVNLDPKLFFTARRIATKHLCRELEKKCNEFAEKNFGLISKKEEFVELEKSYIGELISSKNVQISVEEMLDVILKWIKYDCERSKFLVELMDLIVLSEVSVGYRRYLAENEPLISENLDMYKRFSTSVFNSMKVVPENVTSQARDGVIAIFDRYSGHIQRWNPRDNTWKQMHAMDDDMRQKCFSAVSLGTHIYVLMENKFVYRFKYTNTIATWERLPDMIGNHGKAPPAAVVLRRIFVLGGHGGREYKTGAVEKYDPSVNQWQKLSDLPEPSNASAVLAYKECIYTFGGFTSEGFSKKARKFDPLSLTWTELASMSETKSYAGCAEMAGKIYLMGKAISASTVDVYDVEANSWNTVKCMIVPRCWLRGFSFDGFIYAVGGYNSSPDSIEKYDVQKNEWKMVKLPKECKLDIMESVGIELTD